MQLKYLNASKIEFWFPGRLEIPESANLSSEDRHRLFPESDNILYEAEFCQLEVCERLCQSWWCNDSISDLGLIWERLSTTQFFVSLTWYHGIDTPLSIVISQSGFPIHICYSQRELDTIQHPFLWWRLLVSASNCTFLVHSQLILVGLSARHSGGYLWPFFTYPWTEAGYCYILVRMPLRCLQVRPVL